MSDYTEWLRQRATYWRLAYRSHAKRRETATRLLADLLNDIDVQYLDEEHIEAAREFLRAEKLA